MSDERWFGERRVGERRTTALRGRGAGGFTPETSLAASNPCLNCGTNVQLVYCPECGQREVDTNPTLREFLREAAEQYLGWDGKLFQTLRLLVARPGFLTLEYIDGRRVRYLTPLRTYLIASLLYFFALAVSPDLTRATVTVESSRTAAGLTDEQAQVAGPEFSRRIQRGIRRAQREPGALPQEFTKHLPTLIFLLVPIFAFAVAIAYRDYRRRYPKHLAFALHAHAYAFLIAAAAALTAFLGTAAIGTAVVLAALLGVLWWIYVGARRVYEAPPIATVGRLAMVAILYGGALLLGGALLMMGSYYSLGTS